MTPASSSAEPRKGRPLQHVAPVTALPPGLIFPQQNLAVGKIITRAEWPMVVDILKKKIRNTQIIHVKYHALGRNRFSEEFGRSGGCCEEAMVRAFCPSRATMVSHVSLMASPRTLRPSHESSTMSTLGVDCNSFSSSLLTGPCYCLGFPAGGSYASVIT